MSERRKDIRKQVMRLLKGRTAAKSNVVVNRSETNWQENLPAINLYFRGEQVIEKDQAPRLMKRIIELEVEIIDEGRDGDELTDKLDDLCEQVEQCLSNDDSLRDTADDILLVRVGEMEADSEGSKPTGSQSLFFEITYHLAAPRSSRDQGTFPDLETVGGEWQVGHDDSEPDMAEADRAKDIITYP